MDDVTSQKETTNNETQVKGVWDTPSIDLNDMPIIGTAGKNGEIIPVDKTESPESTDKPEDKSEDNPTEGDTNPDTNDGKPETDTGEGDVSFFTAANGREYKDKDELGNAFNESSAEGIRLANELKSNKANYNTLNDQLTEAQKTILSLQEFVGEGGYPNSKTKDELEEMSEEERQNYYFDKREWGKKVETMKEKMTNAKAETEAYNKQVAEEITSNEHKMTMDKTNFPDFTELKGLRDKILKGSPWLNNKPETPYLTYLLAQGLTYLKSVELGRQASNQSRQAAANKAGGEGNVTGNKKNTQTGAKTPNVDKGADDIVNAYKSRSSTF